MKAARAPRSALSAAVAVVCGLMGGLPALAAPAGASSAPVADVPWADVGPGWAVALLARSTAAENAVTVYLVSPGGRRFAQGRLTFPAPDYGVAVADWSGDKQRVLVTATSTPADVPVTTVVDFDLPGRRELDRFDVADLSSVQFTRPSGTALLVQTGSGVYRATPDGSVQARFPRYWQSPPEQNELGERGTPLYTPDGTAIVFPARRGLDVVSNRGELVRRLGSPTGWGCAPVRWWAPGLVLADCAMGVSGTFMTGGQLWLVPLAGGRPEALTSPRRGLDSPLEQDAWRLPSGTYVQEMLAACAGAWWLGRLGPGLAVQRLAVPGATGNVFVAGTWGALLAVRTHFGCDQVGGPKPPPGDSLAWFDPATGSVRALLGPAAPGSGGTVVDAVLYDPSPAAWHPGQL